MRKYQTLILLLTAYVAATWFPTPGLWLRDFSLGGSGIETPHLLLAGLLFCAGLCSSQDTVQRIQRVRSRLLLMTLAAWLLPLLAASLSVAAWWGLAACPPSVALGILIIAAMPIANSSVGWSASMGGSVSLSIALLVVATALSPVLTPLIIYAGAMVVGTAEQALTETPWSRGMGTFFLLWVLLPVVVGVVVASRLSRQWSDWVVPKARRASFAILIALNYLNGAACLPTLTHQPQWLLWPLLAAASLVLLSYGAYLAFARLPWASGPQTAADGAEHMSLVLAVVLRNTGAALVFAGAALPDFALVSITIIAYTLLQHLWVGFFLIHQAETSGRAAAVADSADLQVVGTIDAVAPVLNPSCETMV